VHADDRVAERDEERPATDERLRAEHRVPEAQQLPLPRVEVPHRGPFERQLGQQLLLARFAERLDQLAVEVEMVLDRGLARAGDEQHLAGADAGQFLDDILHHGFAPDGQHLLRLRLRGWQQTGAEAGNGNDGDFNIHGHLGNSTRSPTRCAQAFYQGRVNRP
jgi:hypothetical protein